MKIKQLSLCILWLACLLFGLPKISFGETEAKAINLIVTEQDQSVISVTGVISDMDGQPLIGVNIQMNNLGAEPPRYQSGIYFYSTQSFGEFTQH